MSTTDDSFRVHVQSTTFWSGFPPLRPRKEDGFPLRNASEVPLWQRAQAWCQYTRWYGPELYHHLDTNSGKAGVNEKNDVRLSAFPEHLRQGFAFPPASQSALVQVERRIGFAHPPLLRDLYLHVSNGGFGPGMGLTGIPGGYSYMAIYDPRYSRLEHTLAYEWPFGEGPDDEDGPQPSHLVDLLHYEEASSHTQLIHLPPDTWPTHCLHLCAGDYTDAFYVHVKSGYVYLVVPTNSGTELHRQTDSLEEWFELWLAGELEYGRRRTEL